MPIAKFIRLTAFLGSTAVFFLTMDQLYAQTSSEDSKESINEESNCEFDLEISDYAHAYLNDLEMSESTLTSAEKLEIQKVLDKHDKLSSSERFAKVLEACTNGKILKARS